MNARDVTEDGLIKYLQTLVNKQRVTQGELRAYKYFFQLALQRLTEEVDAMLPANSLPESIKETLLQANNHYQDESWRGLISQAITMFAEEHYHVINPIYRELEIDDQLVTNFLLSRMLAYIISLTSPLQQGHTFVRGEVYENTREFNRAFATQQDGYIHRYATMSTTYDAKVAMAFVEDQRDDEDEQVLTIMVLNVPPETQGVFMEDDYESEFLLPPCTVWERTAQEVYRVDGTRYVLVHMNLVKVGTHIVHTTQRPPVGQVQNPHKSRFINDLILYATLTSHDPPYDLDHLSEIAEGHPLYKLIEEMKGGKLCN